MSRLRPGAIALLMPMLVLTGCGAVAGSATASGQLMVVTALDPVAFVVERVGGSEVSLTNLAAPGVEPHDLELSPRQVGAIARADLVVSLDGFAPGVDEAVAQNAPDRVLDAGDVVDLLPSADPDHEHEGVPPEQPDTHDHAVDPHFWLDPVRLGQLADAVADRLGALDPDHADAYAARADLLVEELADLDDAFAAGLASCRSRTIVTAHAAFGYLAERYGLHQLSVAGLEPSAEPSAARIAAVLGEVAAERTTTVYFEPLTGEDVVRAVADDLGLDVAVLDPVESHDSASGDNYLTIMDRNLASLRTGQGCR